MWMGVHFKCFILKQRKHVCQGLLVNSLVLGTESCCGVHNLSYQSRSHSSSTLSIPLNHPSSVSLALLGILPLQFSRVSFAPTTTCPNHLHCLLLMIEKTTTACYTSQISSTNQLIIIFRKRTQCIKRINRICLREVGRSRNNTWKTFKTTHNLAKGRS